MSEDWKVMLREIRGDEKNDTWKLQNFVSVAINNKLKFVKSTPG